MATPRAARWVAVHLPQLSLEAFAATLAWPATATAAAAAAAAAGLPGQGAARQVGGEGEAGEVSDRADVSRVPAAPLALLERARITEADDAAQALGVRPGMRRATALALAPALALGTADAVRDAQALLAVAHAALRFTPMVCLHGARTVLLEVSASLRLFGGLPRLLQCLRDEALAPLGHQVRIACAPTAAGAALLALWNPPLPLLGPHATRREALRQLLDTAPAALLCDGPEQAATLQGMGLRTLAEVRALPRAGLARRLGPDWLVRLDRARGDAPDPQDPVRLPDTFEARLELFTQADTGETLSHAAPVLLVRLLAWARARQGRVARLELALCHERGRRDGVEAPPHTVLVLAPAEPTLDEAHLRLLLRERLALLALPAPVQALWLRCDALAHAAPPSGDLFPTRAGEREGLVRLLERLQARLGAAQVQRLERLADHRPERATGAAPLAGLLQAEARGETVLGLEDLPLARPVWLLAQPQPLRERGLYPLLDGRPLQLLAGPQRIESGWWDGEPVARDYFIAQAEDGALVWICRARLPLSQPGAGWFLHGRFA